MCQVLIYHLTPLIAGCHGRMSSLFKNLENYHIYDATAPHLHHAVCHLTQPSALALKTLGHPAGCLILSPQDCLVGAGHVGEAQKILIEGHEHL